MTDSSDVAVRGPEDLTPAWIARCVGQGPIDRISVEELGEGLGVLGRLVRIRLEGDGPATLVAKFPSLHAPNRQLAQAMHLYRREILFYRRFAARTPFVVPRTFHTSIDDQDGFAILMEELGDTRMCDQVAGGSRDELNRIVPVLARHHAAFLGQPLDGAVRFDDPRLADVIGGIYHAAVGPALEHFADDFAPRMRAAARRLDGCVGALWTRLCQGPSTLAHGDFRLDNLGFAPDGQVVCFDWQISGVNVGTYDLGFLMSQSVEPEIRASLDREIVGAYHDALCAGGATGYGLEQCFEDYRRTVLVCLIYPVIVCGMLDVTNERGRAYAAASLRRSLAAIEALDADRLFD